MADPISRLVIRSKPNLPEGEICEEVLRIGNRGQLEWEHYDAGPSVKDHESIL